MQEPVVEKTEDGSVIVILTPAPLDVLELTYTLPRHPACGAISTFMGTTRDNFQGKTVVRLEYEAYVPMAMKKMKEIACGAMQNEGIRRVVIAHRVGLVPVEEPSVIIAIASEHRRSGLEEAAKAIDVVKAEVPIWKKEVYGDGTVDHSPQCSGCKRSAVSPGLNSEKNTGLGDSAEWKQNSEWNH